MTKRNQLNKQRRRRNKRRRKHKQKVVLPPLVTYPKNRKQNIPSINYSEWMKAIHKRDPRVWDAIVNFLVFFEQSHYVAFGARAVATLNKFGHAVYAAVSDEEFSPELKQAVALVQVGHMFQHLMAVCAHETNDAAIKTLLMQQRNVPKLLFLLNPRCDVQIDQAKLFEADPYLSSVWYNTYLLGISTPTKKIQENVYRHLDKMDERWRPPFCALTGMYFTSTYHNPGAARRVKSIINKGVKEHSPPVFENNPNPKSIAIVTTKWHRNHAVYKSAGPLIEQLKDKYKLTLIWTAPKERMPPNAVTDYFDDVQYCHFLPGGKLHIPEKVKKNDYQMVYFPDIGMTDESIWLSNYRMAPIQAMGYGHPETSGDNSEIDYFIGGQVEKESTDQYSETMVLLPGLAQEPAWPTAKRQHNYQDDGIVRINCPWGPDKYNFTLLSTLQEMNRVVWQIDKDSKHEIHMYCSPGVHRYAAMPGFRHQLLNMFPNVHLHYEWEYYDYMKNAEKSDLTINSFPFGGYNTLIESLYMGLPFLTLVGGRFYNRAGMWLNQQIGMSENNFTSSRALIDQATELITNPEALKAQRNHLASIDLKERLFTLKGDHFLKAVDHIIANHPFTETALIGGESSSK